MRHVLPVLAVVAAIIVAWYGAAAWMNSQWTLDQAAREGRELTIVDIVNDTMVQERPKLPAPHQVGAELWKTVVATRPGSKRSLLWHGWVTLSATAAGFGIGTVAGLLLAVGIVHSRAMDLSVMPWAVASQTIPVLAIAPMVIVVLNSVGVSGLLPKAVIAGWLSFFPVVVGMVKGLRAPEPMQLDQMATWNASRGQLFWKLRLPASMPWLFASLKVAVAAALVGTIVGELPAGATSGLGARLLSGSYYGQTVQIWAALVAAAVLAAGLVALVAATERLVLGRMGMRR
ncbi:ABC transporter permease [Frigidibacter sp. MR17.24]|uniref:ABC transporter permease n=1 Tax=Frigidibacter sp. MR17.24 TaxID=3127345 RepID=UPI0030129DD6